ncbi:MAG: hypothetical protein WC648_02805 [Candidatus Paceibacterota bacterium]|jgi:hypothetical protein
MSTNACAEQDTVSSQFIETIKWLRRFIPTIDAEVAQRPQAFHQIITLVTEGFASLEYDAILKRVILYHHTVSIQINRLCHSSQSDKFNLFKLVQEDGNNIGGPFSLTAEPQLLATKRILRANLRQENDDLEDESFFWLSSDQDEPECTSSEQNSQFPPIWKARKIHRFIGWAPRESYERLLKLLSTRGPQYKWQQIM